MNINNAVISGNAKLAMYYLRKESINYLELQEIFSGESDYVLMHTQELQMVIKLI